jgi:hypothetical protein
MSPEDAANGPPPGAASHHKTSPHDMIFSDSTGATREAPTQKPDNSPDALVEKILYVNLETPGGLPPEITEKAIRAEESGTPLYINDEELTIGELLDSIVRSTSANGRPPSMS